MRFRLITVCFLAVVFGCPTAWADPGPSDSQQVDSQLVDPLRDLQTKAILAGRADWGYWGFHPEKYTGWKRHSNRLIPVYVFGGDLNPVRGPHSVYRARRRLERLYGYLPAETLNPAAEYFDQTDIYRLQHDAAAAGKKRIILFIFDGMDWQTAWAAATYRTGEVKYREGRGSGLHFQDYRGAPTDFGYCVTSPHNSGTQVDVNSQTVTNPGGTMRGGYDWRRGGDTPWAVPADPSYLLSQSKDQPQAYTDSSSSASSMTAGIKTYNNGVNVDSQGKQVDTIARQLQRQGLSIGVVTSVPISHATPAAAYAHNVHRDDFQDLTRDLVGLRSIAHRADPLPGVDVLLGGGWGESLPRDSDQGENFVPGNKYISPDDLQAIDARNGGRYRVVQRTAGEDGAALLAQAAKEAANQNLRLFGLFGVKLGHLPYRTADGGYNPTIGVLRLSEYYEPADLRGNPRLTDLTLAALEVLSRNPKGFWLMVEAGDVDWANHDNNLDNSIGAVLDGDDAIRTITDWIEAHGGWDDTLLIVTSDHGHYLNVVKPEVIAEAGEIGKAANSKSQISNKSQILNSK